MTKDLLVKNKKNKNTIFTIEQEGNVFNLYIDTKCVSLNREQVKELISFFKDSIEFKETPCNYCKFNPPSCLNEKPCVNCPAIPEGGNYKCF